MLFVFVHCQILKILIEISNKITTTFSKNPTKKSVEKLEMSKRKHTGGQTRAAFSQDGSLGHNNYTISHYSLKCGSSVPLNCH